jgi:hypothetical protein
MNPNSILELDCHLAEKLRISFPSLKGQNEILHVHCHTDHIGSKVLLIPFVAFSLLAGTFNRRRRKCYYLHYKIGS